MATNNNAVSIGASLQMSLTTPGIGGAASCQLAYADGALGEDSIKTLNTSGFTALNASLGANVLMFIAVGYAVGLTGVQIEAASTVIGTIPAPSAGQTIGIVIPVDTTVIISAKAMGAATNIGVSYITPTANV